ncbi:MAG: hypothetical protein LBJ10_10805 [Clostridiales bacterium]|jgi:hypothetical protein|nr:hypothetical protein [Clostridiales bacterium]
MSRKKRMAAVICIFAAVAVFGVSAASAVNNYYGYEKVKAALFGMAGAADSLSGRNATIELGVALAFAGGETLASARMTIQSDGRAMLTRNTSFAPSSLDGSGGSAEYAAYEDPDVIITGADGAYAEMPNYSSSFPYSSDYSSDSYAGAGLASGFSSAQLRFVEVLVDTLVGDTKNHFVTDGDKVSLSLSGQQIPELAQLALSVVAEELADESDGNGYSVSVIGGTEGPADFYIGADAKFEYVNFSALFDGQGGFSDINADLGISSTYGGEAYDYSAVFDYHVSAVGETVVEKPGPIVERYDAGRGYRPGGSVYGGGGGRIIVPAPGTQESALPFPAEPSLPESLPRIPLEPGLPENLPLIPPEPILPGAEEPKAMPDPALPGIAMPEAVPGITVPEGAAGPAPAPAPDPLPAPEAAPAA